MNYTTAVSYMYKLSHSSCSGTPTSFFDFFCFDIHTLGGRRRTTARVSRGVNLHLEEPVSAPEAKKGMCGVCEWAVVLITRPFK